MPKGVKKRARSKINKKRKESSPKLGKTRVTKSRLALVLHLIGCVSGANFLDQSEITANYCKHFLTFALNWKLLHTALFSENAWRPIIFALIYFELRTELSWGTETKTLLSTIQTIATAWSQYNNASYCLPFTQSSIETGDLGSLGDSCLTYRQLN